MSESMTVEQERAALQARVAELEAEKWNAQIAEGALASVEQERDELLSRLPDGMKHCTIVFKECEKGHGWLTATNWVQHGCPTCERDDIRASMSREIRNLAADCNKLRESGNYFKDQCTLIIGEFAGAVPLPDVLDATKGTTRDLIQYFKAAISERDELRRRVAALEAQAQAVEDSEACAGAALMLVHDRFMRGVLTKEIMIESVNSVGTKSIARIKAEAVRDACDKVVSDYRAVSFDKNENLYLNIIALRDYANQIEGGE